MTILMKVIVYGGPDSGREALAQQLAYDNPVIDCPQIITNAKDMRAYLNTPQSHIGIVNAVSVAAIMRRCPGQKFGAVLFVAAPGMLDAVAIDDAPDVDSPHYVDDDRSPDTEPERNVLT